MLMSPIIGEALQQVGSRIRYSGTLPDRVRELSILLLAGVYRSDFERYAHEPVARALGCTDEELAAAWRGELPATSEGLERTVLETVLSLLDAHDLDETEYANAHGALGDAGLVELIVLVGYYELLATLLTVFRAPVPDAAEER